ncbi:MAG: DUF1223 domain-containing protein [Myxococcota bacterium]
MIALFLAASAAEPVAVVELYTSQGCSSCPAADEVLARIAKSSRADDTPVYVMSFHVDYWNKLGWADPYSDARWTTRQREYSASLGEAGRVYTPQVVVNGTQHAVGSQEPLVKALIAGALSKEAVATVSGSTKVSDGKVVVEVSTENAPKNALLYVAVVEPERKNAIPKGENRGQTGVHANVVRAMVKAETPTSKGAIPVPEGVDPAAVEVFAWVQDPLTNQVLGAAKLAR